MAIGVTKFNFGDGQGNREINPLSTAPTFVSSTSYSVGDYVYYQGTLYKCTTAHSGVWNASHFSATTVSAELQAKESEIADVKSDLSDLEEEVKKHSGLTEEAKEALLECFRHTAFLDHDKDYYTALEIALASDVTLESITAIFSQGSHIFTSNDKLDDLKKYLSIVAIYSDGSTQQVNNYELVGTLSESTSIITVIYRSKQTTFNVAVSDLPTGYTRKNYVQANGTQYILSGLYEGDVQDYGWRYKIMVTEESEKSGHILSSQNLFVPFLVYLPSASTTHRVSTSRYNGSYTHVSYGIWTLNTAYEMEAYMNGGNVIYLDGEETYTYQKGATIDNSKELAFFAYGGSLTNTTYRLRGRLYYMQAFDANGNKLHEYIPCVNSSQVAGLYDIVDGVFLPPTVGTLAVG